MSVEITENIPEKTSQNKKRGGLGIILTGIVALIIIIGVAGALLLVNSKRNPGAVNAQSGPKGKKISDIGPLVSVGNDIIVNLAVSDDGVERYLKVNVILEASNEKVQDELSKRSPQIRDLIINILSAKKKEKIDEKEGKELLRREIINAVNSHLNSGRVRNVFFQDFVIQ